MDLRSHTSNRNLTGKLRSNTNGVRQERYDPCCSLQPQTPTQQQAPTASFKNSGNRKRAQSACKLNSSSPFSLPHEKYERRSSDQNRRRAYSSGPLIGTTVLVLKLSSDSFDCDECSEGTLSSLEEGREKRTVGKKALSAMTLPNLPSREMIEAKRRTKSVPTSIQHAEIIRVHPSKVKSRTSSFLKVPTFLMASRWQKSCMHSEEISPTPQSDEPLSRSNSRKEGMCYRLPSRRRFLHLAAFFSIGILLFSSNNPTSHPDRHGIPTAHSPIRDSNMGDIRIVKNFSGEWGLTLTDTVTAVETSGKRSGNVRKKRQPRLAEANSLSTQKTKQFVLTDDEIRQKTKKLGGKNHRRSNSRKTDKEASNPIAAVAWMFLIFAGIDMVWRPISGLFQRLYERDASTRFPPSLSQHAHYHYP